MFRDGNKYKKASRQLFCNQYCPWSCWHSLMAAMNPIDRITESNGRCDPFGGTRAHTATKVSEMMNVVVPKFFHSNSKTPFFTAGAAISCVRTAKRVLTCKAVSDRCHRFAKISWRRRHREGHSVRSSSRALALHETTNKSLDSHVLPGQVPRHVEKMWSAAPSDWTV
jgi:hypothetical protein